MYTFKPKKTNTLSIYFGVPGCGKTTIASALVHKFSKHYPVWSNVPIKGAYRVDKSDIGVSHFEDGVLILDECSIEFNSRAYKDMSQDAIAWFKLHRHYGMKCICFSQSWNDCDVTLRRLAFDYYLVRKSLVPFVIDAVRIHRKIGINDQTKEPCDEYYFDPWFLRPFTTRRFFAPRYWKLFDSWDAPKLKLKEFSKW